MSLIADALKAAQEAKSGPPGSAMRAASARRILAPATRARGGRGVLHVPKQLQVALAVFGVALVTAAAVVVAAPGGADEELPVAVRVAANPLLAADDGRRPSDGSTGSGASDLPERAAGDAEEEDPDRPHTLADEAASATEEPRRPAGGGSSYRARDRPQPASTSPVGGVSADAERPREHGPIGAPAAAARGSDRGFELRLGSARTAGQWFADALAAQRRRDYAAAIQLYERALQEDPGNVEALNNLGTVYQSAGDLASAREAFRRAITIQPGYASAWSNLGVALGAMGEHEQSQAALTEAIRLDPANHGARVNLALQYQKQGLPREAKRLLEQVVQARPAMAEAHYALGRLLEEEMDRGGAVRHYRLFLSTGAGRFPALEAAVRQRVEQLGG